MNSTRQTGKPRDFVLAIMSKYDWYVIPTGVGDMAFPDLFLDCQKQAHQAGVGFNCRYVSSLHTTSPGTSGMQNWTPSLEIPTPQTLGDFLKLMGPAQEQRQRLTVGILANTIPDESLRSISTMTDAIRVIESTMRFSALKFHLSHRGGELSRHGRYPADPEYFPHNWVQQARYGTVGTADKPEEFVEKWLLPETYAILDSLWLGLGLFFEEREAMMEAVRVKKWLLEVDPPGYKETMCMLAAMLSCGLPLSAFVWMKHRYLNLTFHLGGDFEVLCLISIPRLRGLGWPIKSQEFHAVERLQQRKFLTGRDIFMTTKDGAPIGFLPDVDSVEDNDLFVKHMRALHYQLFIDKDGHWALNKELYVGVDRNGVFRVGVETQGAATPWLRNWDMDSKYVRGC